MQVAITRNSFRSIKCAILEQYPLARHAKNQTLTEALARGLGAKTHAGLIAAMADRGVSVCPVNQGAFLSHLATHGVRMDLEKEILDAWPLEMIIRLALPPACIIEADPVADPVPAFDLDSLSRITTNARPAIEVWYLVQAADANPIAVRDVRGQLPGVVEVCTSAERAEWVSRMCHEALDRRKLPLVNIGGEEREIASVIAEMISAQLLIREGDGAERLPGRTDLLMCAYVKSKLTLDLSLPQLEDGADIRLERATRMLLKAAALAVACRMSAPHVDQGATVNPDGRRLRAERCMPQRSVLQVMPGSLPDRELEIDVPEAFHMLNDAVEEWRLASDEQSMGISVPISAIR
ncbi:hypothetical protein FW320_00410 [Azospirillum sp. Vi22]|uniref:hypothetical protein n=1 Tax=Azospirillum baldaniorum TaxID=1064539 RepID=UPI00157AD1B6|nr:hypothetical protein [Azospirillum baldaniorum]NUB04657.1 hypothetical protein [Azospirillum baldaniorum]